MNRFSDYLELTKPRVVALIMFTAVVGMLLAVPAMPSVWPFIWGTLGIGLAAGSAAAINHLVDRQIDAKMARTHRRPLPTGHLEPSQVLVFALTLGCVSMVILAAFVNTLTAVLTLFSLIGYAVIYTMYLKRATPQNIVIGGAAGAAPPVLGWTAITGALDPHALLLFLIVFVWTPPHFWALAIHRADDYAEAEIPMLPVTHGIEFTALQTLLYTILLVLVSVLPWLAGMSGYLYLGAALVLGGIFMGYAVKLKFFPNDRLPMQTFNYSIIYLIGIFAALLIDHWLLK